MAAYGELLLLRQTVNVVLDGERRLRDLGECQEVATRMRPAACVPASMIRPG